MLDPLVAASARPPGHISCPLSVSTRAMCGLAMLSGARMAPDREAPREQDAERRRPRPGCDMDIAHYHRAV